MEGWIGGFWLVLRLVLPGWAWTWRRDGEGGEGGWSGGLNQAGRIVAAGLVLNLLPVLFWARWGCGRRGRIGECGAWLSSAD